MLEYRNNIKKDINKNSRLGLGLLNEISIIRITKQKKLKIACSKWNVEKPISGIETIERSKNVFVNLDNFNRVIQYR